LEIGRGKAEVGKAKAEKKEDGKDWKSEGGMPKEGKKEDGKDWKTGKKDDEKLGG